MMMLENYKFDYTVEYTVIPLCLGITMLEFRGPGIHEFREGPFVNGYKERWDLWPDELTSERPSEEVQTKYVEEMLSIVHKDILPYFQKMDTSDACFDDWNKGEQIDHSGLLHLKVGNYEKALAAMQKVLKQEREALQHYNSDPDDPYLIKKQIKLKRIKESEAERAIEGMKAWEIKTRTIIDEYTCMIEALTNGDMAYFDKIFAENEAKARMHLLNPSKYMQKG
ncbi:MAG: hypothetical protein FWC73_06130 [Defluviitaleaceae bacterium]|nr:hypothetical protein [Defluviitaleaceae bacterium]